MFPMLNEDETFSTLAFLLNAMAGIGFLAGTIILILRYRRHFEIEIFLIAVIALIQGLSSITFQYSEIWDLEWWLWHIYRFGGDIILLYSVFRMFTKMVEDLELVNKNQFSILDSMPFGLMILRR